MKKIVRLTEGDLHRIIKESVNNIITELDWKTKMNYLKGRQRQGDEAYRQGNEKMARKYWDKASDAKYDTRDEFDRKYNGKPFRGMSDDKFNMCDIYPGNGDICTRYRGKGNYDHYATNGVPDDSYDYLSGSERDKNDIDTFRRMNKDVNDYVNGKSQYIKGKGWQ